MILFLGLPAAQLQEIENGIQVELRFEPVCSNVCQLILHVISIGNATECEVNLLEISKVGHDQELKPPIKWRILSHVGN